MPVFFCVNGIDPIAFAKVPVKIHTQNAPPLFTHIAHAFFGKDVLLSRWMRMQIGYFVKVAFGPVAPNPSCAHRSDR